jgi:hypothetical protein
MSYLVEGEALFNMRDVSLTTIQLCVLLGSAWTASGNAVAENIYYGIACRMAQLMDLPSRPASSQLESEINIRGECIRSLACGDRLPCPHVHTHEHR